MCPALRTAHTILPPNQRLAVPLATATHITHTNTRGANISAPSTSLKCHTPQPNPTLAAMHPHTTMQYLTVRQQQLQGRQLRAQHITGALLKDGSAVTAVAATMNSPTQLGLCNLCACVCRVHSLTPQSMFRPRLVQLLPWSRS